MKRGKTQQPMRDSTKRAEHEISINYISGGLVYDFVLDNWYKIKTTKKGRLRRYKQLKPKNFNITKEVADYLKSKNIDIPLGVYYLNKGNTGGGLMKRILIRLVLH